MKKEFGHLLLSASQLSMLISREITPERLGKSDFNKSPKIRISKAIEQGIIGYAKSTDERYHGIPEVDFAAQQIEKNGLNRDIEEKIYSNKKCIEKEDIVGSFSFLINFISKEYHERVKLGLKRKHEFHRRSSWVHFAGYKPMTAEQVAKL